MNLEVDGKQNWNRICEYVQSHYSYSHSQFLEEEGEENCYGINLQHLNFTMHPIAELLAHTNCPKMMGVDFTSCSIGVTQIKSLTLAKWESLREVHLGFNNIDAQAVQSLKKAEWPLLKVVWIAHNNIGDLGLKYLTQMNWPHLQCIALWQNNLSSQACREITKANWSHLSELMLGDNKIEWPGAANLIFKANNDNECLLNLENNQILKQNKDFINKLREEGHEAKTVVFKKVICL